MSKINKTNVIKFICFALIFAFVFMGLQMVLQAEWIQNGRDNTASTSAFMEFDSLEEDSVDVLFLGTSHVLYGIDPMYLYGNTGYTGFVFSGPGLRMDLTYLTLQDCLRTQKPKVLFLDMSAMHYDTQQDEAKAHKILDQLPLTAGKIEYAFNNGNEELDPLGCIFPLFRYHSRWENLTSVDFKAPAGTLDETFIRGHFISYSQVDAKFHFDDEEDDFQITERNIDYLDRIIKVCEENDIKLICYKVPTPDWHITISTEVTDLLKERGIDFWELYNEMDEIGLNPETDYSDATDHLNQYGSEKLTDYLADYLSDNYDLTDHRGEYNDWDQDYENYLNYKDEVKQMNQEEMVSDGGEE